MAHVALIGGHGVGKSTLHRELVNLSGWHGVPEFARDVLEFLDEHWMRMNFVAWTDFQMLLACERLAEWIKNRDVNCIWDRCIIDVMAYTNTGANHRCCSGAPRVKFLKGLIGSWAKKVHYDLLVFVRFPGYADPNDTTSGRIDAEIERLLKKMDYRVLNVPNIVTTTPEEIWSCIVKKLKP